MDPNEHHEPSEGWAPAPRPRWRWRIPACIAAALVMFLAAGCATQPGGRASFWTNPIAWWTQRGERAQAKAEVKQVAASAELLTRSQRAVQETVVALLTAPPSRPVEVASEAANQASALLAQVNGPLTAPQLAEIRHQVEALLSDNAALRAEGERLRAEQRDKDAATSTTLAKAAAATKAADTRADAIAADNARLAAAYLQMRLAAIAGTVGAALLGIAALALKLNLGGANAALADIIATVRTKAPAAAPLVTAAADAALSRGHQTQIFKTVTALLAARQDPPAA